MLMAVHAVLDLKAVHHAVRVLGAGARWSTSYGQELINTTVHMYTVVHRRLTAIAPAETYIPQHLNHRTHMHIVTRPL